MESIILKFYKQRDGRWFGIAKSHIEGEGFLDILDQHGNSIDCLLDSPEACADSLLKQIRQQNYEILPNIPTGTS